MPVDELRRRIRTVPDWPKAGIQFRDLTPVMQDARLLRAVTDGFAERYRAHAIDGVAGIDARGFVFGAALAHALGLGFVPVRKKGKLPFRTLEEDYALEYGVATLEIHQDAAQPGQRLLLVDDLVATGGTMLAAARLIARLGAEVAEAVALVDLPDLGGSRRIRAQGIALHAVIEFEGE